MSSPGPSVIEIRCFRLLHEMVPERESIGFILGVRGPQITEIRFDRHSARSAIQRDKTISYFVSGLPGPRSMEIQCDRFFGGVANEHRNKRSSYLSAIRLDVAVTPLRRPLQMISRDLYIGVSAASQVLTVACSRNYLQYHARHPEKHIYS